MPEPESHLDTSGLVENIGPRAARGSAITFGAQGVKLAVQLCAVVVLARSLPPHAFGLIAMVATLAAILDLVKELGLSTATIQKSGITHEQVTALFWINAAVGSAVGLTLVLAAHAISHFYHEPALVGVTRWLALGFVISGFTTQHWALLRRQMRFATIAVLETGSEIAGFAIAIAAATAGAGYWALVAQKLVALSLVLIGSWSLCRWRPGRPSLATSVGELVGFGASVTACSIAGVLARSVDQILVGRMFGAVALGFYERAAKLLLAPINNINIPLYSVAIPMLSRISDRDEQYRAAFREILEKLAMVTMPAAVIVAMTADWVVAILFGPPWHDAAPLVACFALAAAYQPVTLAIGLLYLTQGRAREMLRAALLDSSAALVLICAGLPFGVVGVAAFYAIGGLLVRAPLAFWLGSRRGPVGARDLWRSIAPSLCTAFAVGGALWALRQTPLAGGASPLEGLAVAGLAGAAVAATVFAAIPQSRAALASLAQLSRLLRGQAPAYRA